MCVAFKRSTRVFDARVRRACSTHVFDARVFKLKLKKLRLKHKY